VSVKLVGDNVINYLVTAARQAGVVAAGEEQAFGLELVRANIDAYRARCLPDHGVPDYLIDDDFEGPDQDDQERHQLQSWYDTYRWHPVDEITPEGTASAIGRWSYQVDSDEDLLAQPVWSQVQRLAASS